MAQRITSGPGGALCLTLPNGSRLGFREYGDPSGSPLIFFHGWPSSSAQGAMLHTAARARGLRVLSVDRPGIGASTRIPNRTFLHVPPLVDELADALGFDQFDVMGMSGGGPYSLACAWALPHRVKRAVVCCGAPPLDSPDARRKFMPVYRALLALNDHCPRLLRAMLAPAVATQLIPMPWPVFKLLLWFTGKRDRQALGTRRQFEIVYPGYLGAMKAGSRAVHEDGICYSLPWPFDPAGIRVPVRIWHGSCDTNFHWSLAAGLARRIPGAAFFLREEGHFSLPVHCMEEILTDLLGCKAGA